jgi:predicted RNA-binding Zn ribbon-like protein
MMDEADRFSWVGNHPGLDLVNTDAADASGDPLELVPDWSALVGWARTAGVIDAELAKQCIATGDRRARRVLAWFRRLRSALRTVLESGDGREAAAALDAAVAEVPVRLTYSPDGADLPVDTSKPLERMRLAIATAALDATRLDRSRVRRCGSERCVLLYFDTTRNRSRRWCDMAVCGNRAKASAHYHRTKQSPVEGSRHSQPG